jgi:hypothetical protein
MIRRLSTALATLVVATGLAVAGCEAAQDAKALVAAPVDVSGTITVAGAPADYQAALDQLAQLPVRPEDTGVHYDRNDWKHWISQPAFGKGCDTREMILIEQGEHATPAGVGPVEHDPTTCKVVAGDGNSWVSRYDDQVVTDPGALDVDHWVPLEEMARSGTRNWTADQRKQYANDPDVLIEVTAHSNRAKGSQDPATWMPSSSSFGCVYVRHWVEIKHNYSGFAGPLTVDQAEHDALAGKLRSCAAQAAR